MDILRRFNGDKHTKESVLDYVINFIDQQILESAYKGEDVKDLAKAGNGIRRAFAQLDIDYEVTIKPKESINSAK